MSSGAGRRRRSVVEHVDQKGPPYGSAASPRTTAITQMVAAVAAAASPQAAIVRRRACLRPSVRSTDASSKRTGRAPGPPQYPTPAVGFRPKSSARTGRCSAGAGGGEPALQPRPADRVMNRRKRGCSPPGRIVFRLDNPGSNVRFGPQVQVAGSLQSIDRHPGRPRGGTMSDRSLLSQGVRESPLIDTAGARSLTGAGAASYNAPTTEYSSSRVVEGSARRNPATRAGGCQIRLAAARQMRESRDFSPPCGEVSFVA